MDSDAPGLALLRGTEQMQQFHVGCNTTRQSSHEK
jgi:hypothetical protein